MVYPFIIGLENSESAIALWLWGRSLFVIEIQGELNHRWR
jgi:hypothetical protein